MKTRRLSPLEEEYEISKAVDIKSFSTYWIFKQNDFRAKLLHLKMSYLGKPAINVLWKDMLSAGGS